MPKILDPNQLQKIDGRFLQPIYFAHISTRFLYTTSVAMGNGTTTITGTAYTKWADVGVRAGDKFRIPLYSATWRTIESVTDNDTLILTASFPSWEYSEYEILREETFYFSDRNFFYNGHNYEDYLFDLSGIEDQIRNLGGYDNVQVTLRFKNEPIQNKNYLIELLDGTIEGHYIEIYRLLINTGETFGSDVSTQIFKGEMGQPYEIDEIGFCINCSLMLFGKNAKLPLDVIDLYDFPGADPDDVGKYRNIAIGNIKKLVCPWTDAGWVSTLTANIIGGDNSFEVSDANNIPSMPFTAICDFEEIRVYSNSGNTFTVTRGYNSTTAVSHNKGATIYEKKSDFEAEVSMYPVKAIGDIWVKRGSSEWLRLLSGFTKYENTGGRAYIRFSDKPKFEQESDLDVALTLEPHDHDISNMGYSEKQCVPDGSSGPTGHQNVIDGNTSTWCGIDEDVGVQARFDGEADLGTIAKVQIWIHKNDTGDAVKVYSPLGTYIGQYGAGGSGWLRAIKTGGGWTNSVVCIGAANGNQIGEIYKIVEYTPYPPNINTTQLDPYLTGNSVANMVIGDVVACDVEGYPDDGSGTYTGTPNALIERPDHVWKLILMGLLGFSIIDIGSSFTTVGTIYAARISGGYKLAFNLPDVAIEVMDLARQIAIQTRSNNFESGGKFQLAFNSLSEPMSQITFDKHNIEGKFTFSNTEIADVKNKVRAHYFRDHGKSGSIGEKYQKVKEVSNSPSIAKYGEIAEDIEFSCVGDLATMVTDVLEWLLAEKKDIKKIVDFNALWDADILESCDYFTVVSNFFSGYKFKTLKLRPKIRGQIIEIRGIKYGA